RVSTHQDAVLTGGDGLDTFEPIDSVTGLVERDVDQDQVVAPRGLRIAEASIGVATVVHRFDGAPFSCQESLRRLQLCGLVVDDQDAQAVESPYLGSVGRTKRRQLRGRIRVRERKIQTKRCPPGVAALDVDEAFVFLDDRVYEGQSQTLRAAVSVARVVGFEQARQMVSRKLRAVVYDFDDSVTVGWDRFVAAQGVMDAHSVGADLDRAALRCRPFGMAQQVTEGAIELIRRGGDHELAGAKIERERTWLGAAARTCRLRHALIQVE